MDNETILSNPVIDSPAKSSRFRWFFVL